MKKIYKKPSAEAVNVKLTGSLLQEGMGVGGWSKQTFDGDAKESEFEEEEGLINPTQPNLWGDEED